MQAHFKCLRCGYEYWREPEPTQCPHCYHLYVKWINYEDLRKIWNKDGFKC